MYEYSKLNELVAEKVMEWELVETKRDGWISASRYWVGDKHNYDYGEFRPSTRIDHAWQVLEKFDFANINRITGYGDLYTVILSVAQTDGSYQDIEMSAGTVELAICLVALKAVGISTEGL